MNKPMSINNNWEESEERLQKLLRYFHGNFSYDERDIIKLIDSWLSSQQDAMVKMAMGMKKMPYDSDFPNSEKLTWNEKAEGYNQALSDVIDKLRGLDTLEEYERKNKD